MEHDAKKNVKKDDNLTILATKLNRKDAAAFRELCAARGTTISRILSDYIKDELGKEGPSVATKRDYSARHAILTDKNVDLLKHEVAFHNPNHLNPDEMMNFILDLYFKFAKVTRAK